MLLKKAAEDVPLGSGVQVFGRGPHAYTKMAFDGSIRVFQFRTRKQANEAMSIGMAHDYSPYN